MRKIYKLDAKRDPDIAYYVSQLPILLKKDQGKNPFWSEILKDFNTYLTDSPEESKFHTIEKLIEVLDRADRTSYVLEDTNGKTLWKDPHFKKIVKVAERIKSNTYKWIYKRALSKCYISKSDYEHALGIRFLKSVRLLSNYVAFMNSLAIKSEYITTRYFYYLYIINSMIDQLQGRALRVLEIGSGSGNLFLFMANKFKDMASYWFVDLPEMLFLALCTAKKFFPEKQFCILDSRDKVSEACNSDLVFVPSMFVHLIPTDACNFALNTHSFQEMDIGIRNNYFSEVYRILEPNSIFFNVNWFQRSMINIDGTLFDNNPLLYPYATDSKIIRWEEDAFQGYLRCNYEFKNTASLSVLYAGIYKTR